MTHLYIMNNPMDIVNNNGSHLTPLSNFISNYPKQSMDEDEINFFQEIVPKHNIEYFKFKRKMEGMLYPSSIATAVVFFNEEGFAMEKTIKSLQRQQKIEKEGQDLLLVGDGMKHMTSSMATFLQSIFPQAPVHLKEWPDWANTCIVNSISRVIWTQGRLSLVLKKRNLRRAAEETEKMQTFQRSPRPCCLQAL